MDQYYNDGYNVNYDPNQQQQGGGGYTPSQDGVGGFMQNVGQTLTGSNNNFTNAALIPAWAMAAQQFHQAGQYRDLGEQAANRADPFGQYRGYYGDRLRGLYDDPSSIANTPGYKFALNQALDETTSRLRSQGFLGSDQMQKALVDRASGLAQQTYNTEADRLSRLAGSQFDPANAARMQMEGGQLAMQAQSNALGAMFYPFGPGAGGTTVNNNNGGGGSGNPSSGYGRQVSASQIGSAAGVIAQGGAAGFQAAGRLLDQGIRFITNPDGTVTDLQAYTQHGGDIGNGDTTPFYPRIDPNDPNSGQFYNPQVPNYGNDTPAPGDNSMLPPGYDPNIQYPDTSGIDINQYVPSDPLNPYDGFNFDPWG